MQTIPGRAPHKLWCWSAVVLLTFGWADAGSADDRSVPGPISAAEVTTQPDPITATGSLNTARAGHVAAVLHNGKVLIAGGTNPPSAGATGYDLASAELYDPQTGLFTVTGSMATARRNAFCTLIPNGKVFIAGGSGNTSELYDPISGTFTTTGNMATPRSLATSTLLANGKILITGGTNGGSTLASAELYDPATGAFTPAEPMSTPRHSHSATLLLDGRVLIAGGQNATSPSLATAEIYDPDKDTFTSTGSLTIGRREAAAVRLANGQILIAAGRRSDWVYVTTGELYHPETGTFTATQDLGRVHTESLTLLLNGRVLMAGGWHTTFQTPSGACFLYDPESSVNPTEVGRLSSARGGFTTSLLPNGKVLIAGGVALNYVYAAEAELYDPAVSLEPVPPAHRSGSTSTLLPSGEVLLTGGERQALTGESVPLATCELYDPATHTFRTIGSLVHARSGHSATLLTTGKVLIAGGAYPTAVAPAEVFDPATGASTETDSLSVPRAGHRATLLGDGKVLITGGIDRSGAVMFPTSSEIYDPALGIFKDGGSLYEGREEHTATLLTDGTVLIVGGRWYFQRGTSRFVFISRVELYNPALRTYEQIGVTPLGRWNHSATLLADGRVLFVSDASSDIYDPATRTFAAGPTASYLRKAHFARTLPDGRVLFVGGNPNGASVYPHAEIYDPATNAFQDAGVVADGYRISTATVLFNGKVLITAPGWWEVFDPPGSPAAGPQITSAPESLHLPGTLTLQGSGFGTVSSRNPLLRLERLDNEQVTILNPSAFSTTEWSGVVPIGPVGPHRVSILVDGVRSHQRIVRLVRPVPLIVSVVPERGPVAGGQTVTIRGANLENASVTLGGNAAVVTQSTATSLKFVTPAHDAGIVDLVVTLPSGGATTEIERYAYVTDAPAPTDVRATLSWPSVQLTWTAAPGATAYDVMRSSDGMHFVSVGVVGSSTSYTDPTAAAYTAYLYAVRTRTPALSDNSAPDLITVAPFSDNVLVPRTTLIKAAHLTELRWAVAAVCTLAGRPLPPAMTPVARVSIVTAAQLAQLRASLDDARAALALPALTYSRAAPASGWVVLPSDITDLRDGVRRRTLAP